MPWSFTFAGPLVVGCALLAAGCDRQPAPPAQPRATASATPGAETLAGTLDRTQKGSPAPAITVVDAAGRKLSLASLKGRPALVNLWATWCAPCVAELPTLDRLAAGKGAKLDVVTISQDLKTDRVATFLKDKGGPHLPAWLDPQTELSFRYGAQTLPTTVFYDAQGREVWRYVGGHDWSGPDAAKLLAEGGVG